MIKHWSGKLVNGVRIAIILTLLLFVQHADACTTFRVMAKDGAILVGRSMEFVLVKFDSALMIVPRGYRFVSPAPDGKTGLTWKTKYGFVGMNAKGVDMATDGMNEAGLSIGLLYLPEFTTYQKVAPQETSRALAQIAFGNWVLSSFSSVEEVKAALKDVVVFGYEAPGLGTLPLHYAINDSKGGSMVVEYINGKLHVYDNPVGVLTNSPPFDWQLTNLRNYINLTNVSVDSLKLGNYTLDPLGQGTGLLGLPGDFTPPHRFVRATALSFASVPPPTAAEGANLAFHILNDVDIPVGVVASKVPSIANVVGTAKSALTYDFTQWVTVSDLTNKLYYFRTYDNLAIRKVDLKQFSFAGSTIQHISIEGGEQFIDVTKQAR